MSITQNDHALLCEEIKPPFAETAVIQDYAVHKNLFFDFREEPFSNTPDPDFFFMSRAHREALVSLMFGIQERRGFCAVSGEIGAGKTTLIRQLLRLLPASVKTAVILNPKVSAASLLAEIVKDFGIPGRARTKTEYFLMLNQFLLKGLENSQNAVILVDEAQWLSARVLEELRMLSNLETAKQKLLQIVFVGQPELKELLRRESLLQLRQRLAVFLELGGLDADETRAYILHRLHRASGGESKVRFEETVFNAVYKMSRGIPRLINTLCDRILMAAFFSGEPAIPLPLAQRALDEMSFICRE